MTSCLDGGTSTFTSCPDFITSDFRHILVNNFAISSADSLLNRYKKITNHVERKVQIRHESRNLNDNPPNKYYICLIPMTEELKNMYIK